MSRRQHIEDAEQAALIEWSEYQPVGARKLRAYLFAIPNGAHLAGDPDKRAGQMGRLKRAGVKPGVADLFVAVARRQWHGLFIEMKKPRRYFRSPAEAERAVSQEQREFGAGVLEQGFLWVVCYGFDEAAHVIGLYLAGKEPAIEEAAQC